MPIKIEITTLAREVGDRHGALMAARAFSEVEPPPPATHVEIVERTVKTKMRSDGYPDRAHDPEENERVLTTLTIEQAALLGASITGAIVRALDTRTTL